MRHGEVIDVIGPDLVVPSRGVERLGIHDNCECWGAFLHGESAAPFNSTPPAGPDFPFRFPQLIVSMVHPELWTSAFVLTMELDDDPGTLAEATANLIAREINLIAVDASPTAFHQVSVIALAAHRGLTESMQRSPAILKASMAVDEAAKVVAQIEPGQREPQFREAQRQLEKARRALMQEIGRLMIPALALLRLGFSRRSTTCSIERKGVAPTAF